MQESAWLLPAHELRQRESDIEQLQRELDTASTAARPRKKFSFSGKPRAGPAAASAAMQEMAQQAEVAADLALGAAGPSMAAPKPPDPNAAQQTTEWQVRLVCLVKNAAHCSLHDALPSGRPPQSRDLCGLPSETLIVLDGYLDIPYDFIFSATSGLTALYRGTGASGW